MSRLFLNKTLRYFLVFSSHNAQVSSHGNGASRRSVPELERRDCEFRFTTEIEKSVPLPVFSSLPILAASLSHVPSHLAVLMGIPLVNTLPGHESGYHLRRLRAHPSPRLQTLTLRFIVLLLGQVRPSSLSNKTALFLFPFERKQCPSSAHKSLPGSSCSALIGRRFKESGLR
ncbi:hypothetical protein NPIL_477401 [Nephila pilipes]|uniref:Uncharacterized protein n=1 Tax=Nephila pilipes TaxID=299642 RepID=A0A8X6PRV2_NEPPI|nr:hypothetical protein NPIL_477401 [Nephila pilipes]